MKLGVMSAGLGGMKWDKALDYCRQVGLDAIELPVGCYPGNPFFDPAEALKSKAEQKRITEDCAARGLEIIGLAVHGNPVHPDPAVPAAARRTGRRTGSPARGRVISPASGTTSGTRC